MSNYNEPWHIFVRRQGFELLDAESMALDISQGERVVACVNALEGIPDPATLLAVFDEMRAALEGTVEGRPPFGLRALLARAAAVRGGR